MLQQILWRYGYEHIKSSNDSEQLTDLCESFSPDVLFLDPASIKGDGYEILKALAAGGEPGTLVLAIAPRHQTGSGAKALSNGAHDVVLSPFDEIEVAHRVESILKARRTELSVDEDREQLELRIIERSRESVAANLEAVARLAFAAEFRDEDIGEHIFRVGRSTGLLAEKIGLDPILARLFRTAATLHDVGKIAVPDSVLLKPGKLDDDQWKTMRAHTTQGHRMLEGSKSQMMVCAAQIALSHHEHWDGGGYPNGDAGEEISQSARLVSVADVFDALTSKRPYKKAWPIPDAVALITGKSGSQFDPEVVSAFLELDHELLKSPINEEEFFGELDTVSDRLDF